jgi:subtilisin family serine protease
MGSFIQKISILFCLIFLINVGNTIKAQDSSTTNNQSKLKSLSQKFEAEFKANKTHALILAKKNGWAIRQTDSLGNISELMGVDEHGIPIYYSTGNVNAARTIRTNLVNPGGGFGLNLTGKYYTLAVWDGGAVRTTHKEFEGRVIQKDTGGTIITHATHVSGTMVAAGKDPKAKGMAYEANLWAYDWDNDLAEMATAASKGLTISNHSYGVLYGWKHNDVSNEWEWYGDTTISGTIDYHYGFYNSTSKNLDELAFNAKNYLMVYIAHNTRIYDPPTLNIKHKVFYNGTSFFSTHTRASNNNYDCLNGEGVAKNVLTVGAVEDLYNYTKPSDVVMSSFSAWGPTDDGRIKPDICGNGVQLYSTDSNANNSSYTTLSGTSMAAPSVSGSLLLIQNQYNLNTGNFLSAAALKAVAIHTADEAGPNTGPDYQFGWGLMNTKKAVDLINNTDGNHSIKNATFYSKTTSCRLSNTYRW